MRVTSHGRSRAAGLLLFSAWLACSACSLQGLDELALVACQRDADCAVLDVDSESSWATCQRCNQGRCEAPSSLRLREAGSFEPPSYLRYEATGGSAGYMIAGYHAQDRREAEGWVVTDDSVSTGAALRYATWGIASATASANSGRPRNCPGVSTGIGTCDVSDVAVAQLPPDLVVSVAINRLGCDDGQVRVGLSSPDEPFEMRIGSPELKGTLDHGVAVDPDERACTRDADGLVRGARSPAIAGLGGDPPEALAVWLAAKASLPATDGCTRDAREVGVQALRIRVDGSDAGHWLEASSTLPLALGTALGHVTPSVIAADGVGYLVGYAERAAVRIVFVPSLRMQPAQIDQPLMAASVRDENPHHVVLSAGEDPAGERLVLASWRSGCADDGEARLRLVVFRFRNSVLEQIGEPQGVGSGSVVLDGPALHYRATGHRLQASEQGRGGWSIGWIGQADDDAAELLATRLSAADLALEPTRALQHGELGMPFIRGDAGAPVYGFVRREAASTRLMIASCSAND